MNLPLLAGLAFALFGAYLLGHALANRRKALASLSWPSVTGRVTRLRLWGLRRVGGQMQDVERLAIEYAFEVDGVHYADAAPSFYTLVYPETVEFARQHPLDGEVRVHYDPSNPGMSVLVPGPRKDKPHSDMVLGAVALVLGLGVAGMAWAGLVG